MFSRRVYLLAAFAVLIIAAVVAQRPAAESVEIGKNNTSLLPTGKEADGIIGDFVLRNEHVQALISGNQPGRRANMSTEYAFVTPGCLYDFDLRDAGNDQLTAFRPGNLGGELSWVRQAGNGAVEAVRTAAKGDGVYLRHEYRLESGWRHILVTSTYRNESAAPIEIAPAPVWKEFSQRWELNGVHVGDAIDPFDKRAYAWTALKPLPAKAALKPGEEAAFSVAIAVGSSPLEAYGLAAALHGPVGEVAGTAKDASHAAMLVEIGGKPLPAYPDAAGAFRFQLPAGNYTARFSDIGRPEQTKSFTVTARAATRLDFDLPPASAVRFDVRDEAGRPSACKVQFLGRNGTPTPNFGTEYRAHGCDHQYHSHDGQFVQQVPPGDYTVRITRGPEFDMVEREIAVAAGQQASVKAALRRSVDTRGWVSTDYHAHSTPSGDNYCSTRDRMINFAAEHIEFAPTTEHNRIYDWTGHLDKLGLTRQVKTIVGIELTGRGQHFNSFPLQREPFAQDGGAPQWSQDPRITAIVLRDLFGGGADRWVQANHPQVGLVFNDRNADGVEDGGFVGFESMIDAAEVWSTEILNLSPTYELVRPGRKAVVENRTFGWLQMLNQGRHVWCVAVSDAHRIFGNGVGSWRTYVPSSTDDPADINYEEIIRNSKAGRMMVTNGPFLEVRTAEGQPIGSTVIAPGGATLHIRVQAPNWMDVDRVQVLVNGRQPREYDFRRATHPKLFQDGAVKFQGDVAVKVQRDAHLIVVAAGESHNLGKGWGRSWESGMKPIAYTNPIYLDVDGKGFQANGDNLGSPILTVRR